MPATTATKWGSSANYLREGLSNRASFERFVAQMAPTVLDHFHGYSGADIPNTFSEDLDIARDAGVHCELNIKTDWHLASGRQPLSYWTGRLTSLMSAIEAGAPTMKVRFVLNHEPENDTPDPGTNMAGATAAAARWRTDVKALAELIWARGNANFQPQLTFMGYNSKVRKSNGTRFSPWLEPSHWNPAFSTAQRESMLLCGDIYPKLDASNNITVISDDDQSMTSQARLFTDYYALGYRRFGISEFGYNTDRAGTSNEAKVCDAIRGYTAAGTAVTGSLGDWLRTTPYSIEFFSWFENSFTDAQPDKTAGKYCHLATSTTRMSGYKALLADFRGAAAPPAPPPVTPPPPDIPPAITITTRWDDAIRHSHVVELRVDAYRGDSLIASDLPIEPDSATLTLDGNSDVRRTVELTVADPTLVPITATDLLTPHGTELRISRGFRFPDGTVETIPVGVFRLDKSSTPLHGEIRVSGADRSRLIAEDRLLAVKQSVTGATVAEEITRLIRDAYPDAVIVDTSKNTTVCKKTTWEAGTSPWQAVGELALSIGVDVAPDAAGTFRIRPMPTLADTPVFTIDIGQTGVITGGTEGWERERTFNAVVARGEGTAGKPVQAIAYELAGNSPTFWNGDYGHRPKEYSSPLLATPQACAAAAATILRRVSAPARMVTVSCVPNPALDFGDVVELVLPPLTESDQPRIERHMVWGYRLPLGLGAMELRLYSSDPDPGHYS